MSIELNTKSMRLEFDEETGAVYRITALKTGWDIMNSRESGLSWRNMIPLSEELRNNNALGEKQRLSSYQADEDRIVFRWDRIHSERGGEHEISVVLTIRSEGRQAVYEMEIDNRSAYMVENVYCPYLGALTPPEGAPWLKLFAPKYGTAEEKMVWPQFTNTFHYCGVDYPAMITGDGGSPAVPFILLRTPNQGLYMGIKSKSCDYTAWYGELRPGWESSIDSRVSSGEALAGKPVQTRFAALHVPYIKPGEKRLLPAVALEAYTGGWNQGADIYAGWRKSWMSCAAAPQWAREPHSWQQLHINSPEDELRLKFIDLPEVAAECKKHGVKAIQLVGWNDGGQDQGNPSHSPDPRLGTSEELKEAIKACQELGVKVILFAKFVWADRGTKWFREELVNMAVKDPYGDYYLHPGYKYQTGTQLLDLNTKRLIPMCFGAEAYMKICEREFLKMVELGADGILIDECMHHGPARLCFDESHGHRYGWPVYANDRRLIERFRTLEGVPEDFLIAGEACYDWEMEAYELSYFRSEDKEYLPLSRYLWPQAQYMTAVTGFNDRNMLNQCLMYRFIISYEPYNFKGRLEDYPETVAYGQKVDEIRREYRKWFWDGKFQGTKGVTVSPVDGGIFETYGVFAAEDNSVGVVICNYEDTTRCVNVNAESGRLRKYRLVEDEAWKPIEGGVVLPPRSAAIIL